MFALSVPWWEFVVRSATVYVFLFVMLRLTGKRQVGQLAPFDLILLLILSNAVQNSMNAGDNSLVGGLVSATTLILLNWATAYATFKSKRFEEALEGKPLVVVREGKLDHRILADEYITRAELEAALRATGTFKMADAKLAMLETNGSISVWSRDKEEPNDRSPAP
jgi:uncharacterized membrane protein YcaP (DUF421 family)